MVDPPGGGSCDSTGGPVVVVGGGIVGASVAYHLRDERNVTLVEKSTLGGGTTAASIAQFIEYQDDPAGAEAVRRRQSWAFYDALIEDGTFEFDRIGTQMVASSEADLARLRRLGTDLDAAGVATELLPPAELTRYGIDPETVHGALRVPDDGVLDPGEIVQYLAGEARAAGVAVDTGTTVTDVHVEDGRVTGVETSEGDYAAATVVNAAGPWAPQLDAMVGVSTPLRHTHGPVLVLDAETDVSLPLTFLEDGYYVREAGDRQLLAGKFATEYADATTLSPDANHGDAAGEAFHLAVAELLGRHFPSGGRLEATNSWVGLRTVTPDGRPLVGPTSVDGYVHATGMSGHGITLAPVVGGLLAQWVRTGDVPDLLEAYLPARFD